MPRVIVVPDAGPRTHHKFLDEQVSGLHLDDDHSALQLIERLAWAIHDAEEAEQRFSASLTPRPYTEVAAS